MLLGLTLGLAVPGSGQSGARGEVLGVTIEPGQRLTRMTVRLSAAVRPVVNTANRERVTIDLPETSPGSLPPELPVEVNGVNGLRIRRAGNTVRLELELSRRLGVKVLPPLPSQNIVIEIGEANAQPELFTQPAGAPALTPLPPQTLPAPAGGEPRPLDPPRDQRPSVHGPMPSNSAPAAIPLGAPRLQKIAVVSTGKRVQLRIEATAPCQMRHGYLPGKMGRCFIDLDGVLLGGTKPAVYCPQNAFIQSVRFGQNSTHPPVVRIVLDLQPGVTEEAFLPDGASPALLVGPNGRPLPPYRPPAIVEPDFPSDPEQGKGFIVAVDAGHGGGDPGALGPEHMQEKAVTLDVALRLSRWLRERGCQVRLSRRSDSSLPPPLRTAWITQTPSHVLVSIHCDAVSGRPNVSGATTYFHQAQGVCRALAEKVQRSLVQSTGAPDLGVRSDNTRYNSGFYILRAAARPAVLVETGYISHAPTARLLGQEEYRQKIAEGIGRGILAFLSARANRGGE